MSSFRGNPPSRNIEWTSSPSIETSNAPSNHGMSSIAVSRVPYSVSSFPVRLNACKSYPHSAQYMIAILTVLATSGGRAGDELAQLADDLAVGKRFRLRPHRRDRVLQTAADILWQLVGGIIRRSERGIARIDLASLALTQLGDRAWPLDEDADLAEIVVEESENRYRPVLALVQ